MLEEIIIVSKTLSALGLMGLGFYLKIESHRIFGHNNFLEERGKKILWRLYNPWNMG